MSQAPTITYAEALALFTKPAAMAKALNVSRASVSEWKEKGVLPEGRVWQLIAMFPERFRHFQPQQDGAPVQLALPSST
jgi:hypothetical protein